jgi:2-C-methyl-D-erythritol 4-phosphate cytidylyltransferase
MNPFKGVYIFRVFEIIIMQVTFHNIIHSHNNVLLAKERREREKTSVSEGDRRELSVCSILKVLAKQYIVEHS